MKKINKILEEKLTGLKLQYFLENYQAAAQLASESQMPYLEFLAELVEGETAERNERAVERRLRNSKLPFEKSMDQFQWSHPEKINRLQIENIMRLDFIDKKANVLIVGGSGLGKSHIASSLIRQACLKGYNALFTSAIEIVNYLTAARAANCLDKALKRYLRPDIVAVDEIGYLPIDKLGCDLLFQVVSQRYERGSIIITSNKPFKNWTEIFHNDAAVTSAILDRLLHHSEVVIIEGKSYRMKDRSSLN
ncbi:MAG: IS21-like element helper ATPase IstB [Victivallaceae bacterium]|nr:IS21-like element helper ATPase IstB [Victivallaceae bacterium]